MHKKRETKGTALENTSQQARRRFGWIDFFVSLFALGLILPALLLCTTVVYFQTQKINLPGVFVYDQDVGMLSAEQTAEIIDRQWNKSPQIQLVSSTDPQVAFTLRPSDLGFWVDAQGTAEATYEIGRDIEPFPDVINALQGKAQYVMPILYYDEQTAWDTLQSINEAFSIQPTDASLIYEENTWKTLPASSGRTLDIETTLAFIRSNPFNTLLTQSVPLHIQTLSPTLTDLSSVLEEIEAVVAQDLRIEAYDPITDEHLQWEVPIALKRSWVSVDPSSNQVHLKINQNDLADLVKAWEESLGKERRFESLPEIETIIAGWEQNEIIYTPIRHKSTNYTVQPGESLWSISLKLGMPMWHILDANEGLTVNNVQSGMTLNIPSKNILLPLPVVPEKRIIIDISDQVMQVYENGQVRNTHIVSTGMSDSPTMPGIFQVQSHYINAYASNWDLYMPHFLGIYEAWPDFMNGIHGLPLLSSGVRLWASSLGSPASYGCIILDLAAAEDLYYWAEDGVVVEIRR